MKNIAIDTILFTVKNKEKEIADVMLDLKEREYAIVYTDLYGHVTEPETGGRLRKKAIEKFGATLDEIDIVAMPVNKTNTLPIKMNAAMVTYFMKEKSYNTDGPIDGNLANLHKAIEQLIGKTFGSYDFYQ